MADVVPQKRVLPARERRESAAKRRASYSTVQESPALKESRDSPAAPSRPKRKYNKRSSTAKIVDLQSRTPSLSPDVEIILPTKFTASKSLPTLPQKQPEVLSTREYQSVADSAVLSASLHRSRIQWLAEGIFKRYWVKPVKRKGVVEQPPGNPDVKSMQKLGNATITIEPHTFDVVFYTVRELVPVPAQPYRHPNQHTAKPSQPLPPPTAQPVNQQPILKSPATVESQPPKPVANPLAKQENAIPMKQEPAATTAIPPPPPSTQPAQTVPPPAGPPKPSDDPVIQMLAARAASDPRLKGLMKIVALSQATPEQLREFQSHIDEFNKIIKARDAKGGAASKSKPLPVSIPAQHATASNSTPRGATTAVHTLPAPGVSPHVASPYLGYPPQLPPPRPEAIIKHIIVEFHSPVSSSQGATTDRYLFPEHAVLEMRTNGMEMVASFFVEKKGEEILKSVDPTDETSAILRQKYKTEEGYFQPVTMLIKATHHRTIEAIARAAKPLVEVQAYLNTVMEKKKRAPQEYLAYQLPRDKSLSDTNIQEFADSGVDVSADEDDELKGYYGF